MAKQKQTISKRTDIEEFNYSSRHELDAAMLFVTEIDNIVSERLGELEYEGHKLKTTFMLETHMTKSYCSLSIESKTKSKNIAESVFTLKNGKASLYRNFCPENQPHLSIEASFDDITSADNSHLIREFESLLPTVTQVNKLVALHKKHLLEGIDGGEHDESDDDVEVTEDDDNDEAPKEMACRIIVPMPPYIEVRIFERKASNGSRDGLVYVFYQSGNPIGVRSLGAYMFKRIEDDETKDAAIEPVIDPANFFRISYEIYENEDFDESTTIVRKTLESVEETRLIGTFAHGGLTLYPSNMVAFKDMSRFVFDIE